MGPRASHNTQTVVSSISAMCKTTRIISSSFRVLRGVFRGKDATGDVVRSRHGSAAYSQIRYDM